MRLSEEQIATMERTVARRGTMNGADLEAVAALLAEVRELRAVVEAAMAWKRKRDAATGAFMNEADALDAALAAYDKERVR